MPSITSLEMIRLGTVAVTSKGFGDFAEPTLIASVRTTSSVYRVLTLVKNTKSKNFKMEDFVFIPIVIV